MDLAVRSSRVVLPEGVRPAAVVVSAGRIERITSPDAAIEARVEIDAGDSVVMAGLVDTHVHVNDPGRTEWEGFETAGRAAAAGGTTTIVDMPLNSSPVTTTVAALEAKVAAARGACRVDYGVWGGIVPGNLGELPALLDAGALGFKAFLVPSGIDEFPPVDDGALGAAMAVVAGRGAPVLVHAEDAAEIARAGSGESARPESHAAWAASRPASAEARAVARVAALSGRSRARAHIVHASSEEALGEIRRAKSAGIPLTAETCPHYLCFASEEVADGDTRFKCAPPIRDAGQREALWRGLGDGTLDLVASDHSPCPPALKPPGDFGAAWGGIGGLELRLPATWTEARRRGISLVELARWLAEAPARLAGLSARKGGISAGLDADLVVWDPDREFEVEAAALHQRHCANPWEGRTLAGVVETTILRGRVIYEQGSFPGSAEGRWLAQGSGSATARRAG
ncbi:MAG TPA: allantoinase AllB [Gemmatimonadota bacterium]|nr:allantoinase AllB [Gemmatimonadota bacterium]